MKKFYLNGISFYLHESHSLATAVQLFVEAGLASTLDTLEVAEDQDQIGTPGIKFSEIAYISRDGAISFTNYKSENSK